MLRGARERLSPILMTALATGLALVPLVIAGDMPGHEIEYPMAIVILGGLVTSTLLNLFIVPAIFLRFGKPANSSTGGFSDHSPTCPNDRRQPLRYARNRGARRWPPGLGRPAADSAARRTCAFRAGDFSRQSIDITNKWLPLKPGMQFTLEGHANSGGGVLPHTVVLTVTDVTKTIAGVQTVVLWDRDFEEGQLTEAELAFQPRTELATSGAWVSTPRSTTTAASRAPRTPGSPARRRRTAVTRSRPTRDRARQVTSRASRRDRFPRLRQSVPQEQKVASRRCYDHVLVTDETSPLAGTAHQRKFYAAGVGNVKISAVNDPEGETLVLAKLVQLDKHALNLANEAALKLDRHGYRVSDATPSHATCSGVHRTTVQPSIHLGWGWQPNLSVRRRSLAMLGDATLGVTTTVGGTRGRVQGAGQRSAWRTLWPSSHAFSVSESWSESST